jgi:hypothetical protein
VHTSGGKQKPPSKLLSAHINISLVEAPTTEYYYYNYSILDDASMHNVTMRIVANGFDDALHIAFGETLLAAHER